MSSRIPEILLKIDAEMRAVEQDGAQLIRDDARRTVAVNKGYLRENIHTVRQPEGVYVVAGTRKVYWGRFLEKGTPRMTARPFLVPSVESHQAEFVEMVRDGLRRATS